MDDLRNLSDLAAAQIETLQEEGITPTPREIVAINALAWSVETQETRRQLARGLPAFVGDQALWPLTLRAAEWLSRILPGIRAVPRIAQPPEFLQRLVPRIRPIDVRVAAIGYAMAHAYAKGQELDQIGDTAIQAILAWRKTLRCTETGLELAIDQVQQQETAPEEPPVFNARRMTPGDLSAFLAASTGGNPEAWERQCAISYVRTLIQNVMSHNEAEGKPSLGDPRIRAVRALAWYVEGIRSRAKRLKAATATKPDTEAAG